MWFDLRMTFDFLFSFAANIVRYKLYIFDGAQIRGCQGLSVTIASKPQVMMRMSETKYVYKNRIHIFEMRRTQPVTGCNM